MIHQKILYQAQETGSLLKTLFSTVQNMKFLFQVRLFYSFFHLSKTALPIHSAVHRWQLLFHTVLQEHSRASCSNSFLLQTSSLGTMLSGNLLFGQGKQLFSVL